jgi:hypothetical protein
MNPEAIAYPDSHHTVGRLHRLGILPGHGTRGAYSETDLEADAWARSFSALLAAVMQQVQRSRQWQ